MWEARIASDAPQRQTLTLHRSERAISYAETVALWQHDAAFRDCKAAPTPREALACQIDVSPTRPAIDGQSLSVARAKWNLGEESSVGMIFTNGDPRDEIDNNLLGADLIYRTSGLPGLERFVANGWVMRTQSSGVSPLEDPIAQALRKNPFPAIKHLRRDEHQRSASCWLHAAGCCLSMD